MAVTYHLSWRKVAWNCLVSVFVLGGLSCDRDGRPQRNDTGEVNMSEFISLYDGQPGPPELLRSVRVAAVNSARSQVTSRLARSDDGKWEAFIGHVSNAEQGEDGLYLSRTTDGYVLIIHGADVANIVGTEFAGNSVFTFCVRVKPGSPAEADHVMFAVDLLSRRVLYALPGWLPEK